MKKVFNGYVLLIGALSLISIGIYAAHYYIFGNIAQTISGLILSLAYVPIGMLYEILILDKILKKKQKLNSAKRMNLIVGSFYHDVGNDVIKLISKGDSLLLNNECYNNVKNGCKEISFSHLVYVINNHDCILDVDFIDLKELYMSIENKDTFILSLITNSSLDIYDEFIEMLMSLLHLRDELQLILTKNTTNVQEKYYINNVICTAYLILLKHWVKYMLDLKEFYPAQFKSILQKLTLTI